jgi:hypothetical protein
MGWGDYADLLDQSGLEVQALQDNAEHVSFTGHEAGLRATLRISDRILDRTPGLRDVLDLLAWSGAGSMGRGLLGAALGGDSPAVGVALRVAESLRILKREVEPGAATELRYMMHRLVREVRRLDVPFDLQRTRWAEVPKRIGDWFQKRREFSHLPEFEAELEHIDAWQAHAQALSAAPETSRLLWLRAYPPFHRGRYAQSHDLVRKAHELFTESGAADRELLADLHDDLGATYDFLGDHRAGLEYAQQALAIRREVLGERHPETARSLDNVGASFDKLGDHRAGLEYAQQALAIRREVLGERHPETARSLDNVGASFDKLGDHRAGLEYAQRSLAVRREVLGERHRETAASLNSVGISLGNLGDHRAALEHKQQALVVLREVLGEHHPDTLRSRISVAQVLINRNHKVAALRAVEEGLKHAPNNADLRAMRSEILGRKAPTQSKGPKNPKR